MKFESKANDKNQSLRVTKTNILKGRIQLELKVQGENLIVKTARKTPEGLEFPIQRVYTRATISSQGILDFEIIELDQESQKPSLATSQDSYESQEKAKRERGLVVPLLYALNVTVPNYIREHPAYGAVFRA